MRVDSVNRPSLWQLWALVHGTTLALLLLGTGCGTSDSDDVGSGQGSVGYIAPEPFLTLRDSPSQAPKVIGSSGVYHLPDGNTVIADAQQLRWFDSIGHVVDSASSSGVDGVGHRDILWMRGYRGDSLIAYDAASGEFGVWDAGGSKVRNFRLTTDVPLGFILPHSASPDGSILALIGPAHSQKWRDGWWSVLGLATFTAEGALVQKLGTAMRHPCREPIARGCAGDLSTYQGTWTAAEGGAYIARPDRADIRWVSADSTKILKGPEEWVRHRADKVPTYSRLLVDSETNLWAQSGDGSRAAVFDRLNTFVGTVEVPPKLKLHQVGLDFVVGVIEGANGAWDVQIHSLHRSPQR